MIVDGEALILCPVRKSSSHKTKAAARRMMDIHDETLRKLSE